MCRFLGDLGNMSALGLAVNRIERLSRSHEKANPLPNPGTFWGYRLFDFELAFITCVHS